jgi:hypothetical protein
MPGIVERRVEQAPQHAGLIQRRLAVPHQVDQGSAVRRNHQRTAYLPPRIYRYKYLKRIVSGSSASIRACQPGRQVSHL